MRSVVHDFRWWILETPAIHGEKRQLINKGFSGELKIIFRNVRGVITEKS